MENAVQMADQLPRYILIKEVYYTLVIYKHEWDGHTDAWIIVYAEVDEDSKMINMKKPLLKAEGADLLKALEKMTELVTQFRKDNKGNPDVHKC